MKGIYLCAKKHRIPGYNIDYNDIENYPGITHCCNCEEINLNNYDYIIATPPCNYYSKANYRRETSKIAQETKHLLPYCIDECIKTKKPFIVENVNNKTLLPKRDIYSFSWGGHTYYTNVLILLIGKPKKEKLKALKGYGYRDNNINVDTVIKWFLETIGAKDESNN